MGSVTDQGRLRSVASEHEPRYRYDDDHNGAMEKAV
jgi:hypothetical protein